MAAHPTPEQRSSWPRHTPVIVAGVSFLFPGFGHILIGEWARGLTWAVGVVVLSASGGGVFVLVLMAITAVDGYVFARDAMPPPNEEKP